MHWVRAWWRCVCLWEYTADDGNYLDSWSYTDSLTNTNYIINIWSSPIKQHSGPLVKILLSLSISKGTECTKSHVHWQNESEKVLFTMVNEQNETAKTKLDLLYEITLSSEVKMKVE